MKATKHRRLFSVVVSIIILLGFVLCAQGQWGPPGGQQPSPAQNPNQPSYPSQPQQYPYSQSSPPAQAWALSLIHI